MDMKMPTQGVMKYPRAEVWASTPPVRKLQLQSGGGWSHRLPRRVADASCPASHHALLRFASRPPPLCSLTNSGACAGLQPSPTLCFSDSSLLLSTYYMLIIIAYTLQSRAVKII